MLPLHIKEATLFASSVTCVLRGSGAFHFERLRYFPVKWKHRRGLLPSHRPETIVVPRKTQARSSGSSPSGVPSGFGVFVISRLSPLSADWSALSFPNTKSHRPVPSPADKITVSPTTTSGPEFPSPCRRAGHGKS